MNTRLGSPPKFSMFSFTHDFDGDGWTDLATTIHEPGRAYQWGTLVDRAHRGHRLGVAVKVANLRLLQRERARRHRGCRRAQRHE